LESPSDDTAQDDPQGSTEMKLLNAPVMIQQKLKDQDSQSVMASINAVQLDDRGGIDRKKLDKADLKIKQKQEKRSTKQVTASQTVKAK
jgi:hypothetical protein